MGLFSFVKNAGAKLFGFGDDKEKQEELSNDQKADQLISAINQYGIHVDSLYVAVEGDLATVAGECSSQDDREKVILICGNVEGIAQVDDKLSVISMPETKFHTVVGGDTLSKIAGTYYGDVMQYNVIFEANKPMLKHPDKIYVGQVLRIPAIA